MLIGSPRNRRERGTACTCKTWTVLLSWLITIPEPPYAAVGCWHRTGAVVMWRPTSQHAIGVAWLTHSHLSVDVRYVGAPGRHLHQLGGGLQVVRCCPAWTQVASDSWSEVGTVSHGSRKRHGVLPPWRVQAHGF